MVKIPLQKIPNQKLAIVLGGQNCIIHLYQRGDYMYIDLNVNGVDVRTGGICLVDNDLVGFKTTLWSGILFFVDMQDVGGVPYFEQLNDRYVLFYDEVTADV